MFRRQRIPSIDAKGLQEKINQNENITLLDVRKPNEWKQTGIIPGSLMVEMQTLPRELENGLKLTEKSEVIVICKTGRRSNQVTKYLIDNFQINAINLSGGIVSWYQNNGNIERI